MRNNRTNNDGIQTDWQGLYSRQAGSTRQEGQAVTNFTERLPAPGTDLVRQSLKDFKAEKFKPQLA
jgi:hypothetical protein